MKRRCLVGLVLALILTGCQREAAREDATAEPERLVRTVRTATVSPVVLRDSVVSLGGRYRNQSGGEFNFGASYEGDVFFHDWGLGEVRRLKWNGAAWVTPPPVPGQPGAVAWATGFDRVTDAILGPDGAIYYVRMITGQISRLTSDLS